MRLPRYSYSFRAFASTAAALALTAFCLPRLQAEAPATAPIPENWRNLATGWVIPDEDYSDQPYIAICDDGSWLCVMTTSNGHEGAATQHIVATRSKDFGRTWSDLIPIERVGPPESSYATILKVPSGRLYVFYNYNKDNLREVLRPDGKTWDRVDTLGGFFFKYSDDHGATWSSERYEIPLRETAVDRANVYQGKVRFFWHVGRPLVHQGAAYVTLHKVGAFSHTFIDLSEGNFLRSDNILTEPDPHKIRWEMLPEGDVGLKAPAGRIAEEHSIVGLSDGSLYTVYRTDQDSPGHAYSRDNGKTWTPPAFMTYGPGARKVKHARAANFVWKGTNGRYLYWYHNHGGFTFSNQRNPAWISGGREVDTPAGKAIAWSEPEVLFYDADMNARISYPDFVEDNGRYFFTETQKTIARAHEVPAAFIEMLWNQHEVREVATKGLVVNLSAKAVKKTKEISLPPLPQLVNSGTKAGGGFTMDFWVKLSTLEPGQIVVDSRDAAGNGFSVSTTDRGTIQLSLRGALGDGYVGTIRKPMEDFGLAEASWDCDPGLIKAGQWHHVAITVDGGPKIISFIVDGQLNDGGDIRQFGWARFARELRTFAVADKLRLAPRLRGQLGGFRLYDRALYTSEVIGNWRSGRAK